MCPQLGTQAVRQPMTPGLALGVSRFHGGLQRRCRSVRCRVWVQIVDVAGCETLICASRSPVGRRAGHAMGRTNCTLVRYMHGGGVVPISRPDGKMSSATLKQHMQ
jgi:hypothetical protein